MMDMQLSLRQTGDEALGDRHAGQSLRLGSRYLVGMLPGLKNSAWVGKFGRHERLGVSKLRMGRKFESAGEVHQPKRRAEASCSASRRRARISGSTRTLPNTTYRTAAAGESVGRLSIS